MRIAVVGKQKQSFESNKRKNSHGWNLESVRVKVPEIVVDSCVCVRAPRARVCCACVCNYNGSQGVGTARGRGL